MTVYDDKKIQNLVKKLTKNPKPGKTYDKTAPQRGGDDQEVEREKFFKEMKRREF